MSVDTTAGTAERVQLLQFEIRAMRDRRWGLQSRSSEAWLRPRRHAFPAFSDVMSDCKVCKCNGPARRGPVHSCYIAKMSCSVAVQQLRGLRLLLHARWHRPERRRIISVCTRRCGV